MPMRFRCLDPSAVGHVDPAVLGNGLVELRDLVALGQVGIEVVFARKDGALAHLAVEGERGERGKLDSLGIEHRQRARQPQAHRADVGVGRRAKMIGATAEGLGSGEQLHVDFESDDGLVLGQDFGRKCERRAYGILARQDFLSGRSFQYSERKRIRLPACLVSRIPGPSIGDCVTFFVHDPCGVFQKQRCVLLFIGVIAQIADNGAVSGKLNQHERTRNILKGIIPNGIRAVR